MNLDDQITIVDENGLPDHVINPGQITDDAWTLALKIGASEGEQKPITDAIAEVLTKWGDSAGYVLTSAITQLGRDLVPMVASLAKTTTGVDWHAHCAAMLEDDYDPYDVDKAPGA